MGTIDARTWMELIGPAECWELLDRVPVGRVGVIVDSAPEIYPVNHIVDGHTIVFRTDPGTKLAGLAKTPAVCFQVDGIDAEGRSGWSVLVKGRAGEVLDAADRRRLTGRGLEHWTVGAKPHWIRIEPTEVTGRRIYRSTDDMSGRDVAARPLPGGEEERGQA